jgi:hypothetical protein
MLQTNTAVRKIEVHALAQFSAKGHPEIFQNGRDIAQQICYVF